MPLIPGTQVEAIWFSFGHEPPTPDQRDGKKKQQPHLFYDGDDGNLNLASVNAGNSEQLYVGGGGVNGAFADVLSRTQQNVGSYQERHQKLLARADTGGQPWEKFAETDPCAFSFVNPGRINQIAGSNEGVCFVDVFDPVNSARCPGANPRNIAILYAAPPEDTTYIDASQNYAAARTGFLAAIQALAGNIVKTISGYNAIADEHHLPKVEVLRNTLYSSGIYNGDLKVPAKDIARAIFAGLTAELKNDPGSGLLELQFPVGNGKIYQDDLFLAVKQDMAAQTERSAEGGNPVAAMRA